MVEKAGGRERAGTRQTAERRDGGKFGVEYRDKFLRHSLAQAAFAAYGVMNSPALRTGAHYYASPPIKADYFKSLPAYKAGHLELLNLNITGISTAAKLTH